MRLSHRQFDSLNRAILELHAYRDVEEFWKAVPAIFLKLFPADYFVMTGYGLDPIAGRAAVVESRESEPRINQQILSGMERFVLNHPFTKYFMRTGDPTALKLSDFFSGAQLRDEPVYREGYRPWGINRCLSVGITSLRSNAAGISVAKTGKDFTEQHRLLMNLLQPHFDLALRNAERATVKRNCGLRPLQQFRLSPREREVSKWLAEGKTNPEIAIILCASVRTIEKHVASIIEKVGAPNRTTAALIVFNDPPAR